MVEYCEGPIQSVNMFFTVVMYIPIGIIMTTVFFFLNLAVFPFAYLTQFFRLVSQSVQQSTVRKTCKSLAKSFQFLVVGFFLLLLSLVVDTFIFGVNLFTAPVKDYLKQDDKSKMFTEEGLILFEETVDDQIHIIESKLRDKDQKSQE